MKEVLIKKSNINGKGVFANKIFRKGDVVLKWNPSKLTEKEKENLTDEQKNYIICKNEITYLMNSPEKYVNHSCNPNTYMNLDNFCDIAIKNIKIDEEITSSYSNPSSMKQKCNCASKNCKGNF